MDYISKRKTKTKDMKRIISLVILVAAVIMPLAVANAAKVKANGYPQRMATHRRHLHCGCRRIYLYPRTKQKYDSRCVGTKHLSRRNRAETGSPVPLNTFFHNLATLRKMGRRTGAGARILVAAARHGEARRCATRTNRKNENHSASTLYTTKIRCYKPFSGNQNPKNNT